MRSARLRLPSNINLLVKRATFRLLYFASGTSGRRTALLRLGTICLLISKRNKLLHPTQPPTTYVYFAIPALKKNKRGTYGRCRVHGHQKRRRFRLQAASRIISFGRLHASAFPLRSGEHSTHHADCPSQGGVKLIPVIA